MAGTRPTRQKRANFNQFMGEVKASANHVKQMAKMTKQALINFHLRRGKM